MSGEMGVFPPSAAPGAHPKDHTLSILDIPLFGEEGRSKSFLSSFAAAFSLALVEMLCLVGCHWSGDMKLPAVGTELFCVKRHSQGRLPSDGTASLLSPNEILAAQTLRKRVTVICKVS